MEFAILLLLKILLFINITTVEHNAVLVFFISALFILFIFSIIYFSERKKKKLIGLVTYIILSLILFVDVLHYTYFNALPSVKMLSQVTQVAAVGESLMSIFTFKNMLMVLDLPIVMYLTFRKRKKEENIIPLIKTLKEKNTENRKWMVPGVLLVAIIVTIFTTKKLDLFDSIRHQEIFAYHAMDIKESLGKKEPELDIAFEGEDTIKELRERARLKKGKHTGIGKDKNLIVLQVEALQSFVINMEYEGQVVTPNLNKLIKDSGTLYFDNYYQLIGRGNTSDAEFVSNNSLYPSMEEPSYTSYQDNTFYGLPQLLKEKGYSVWAFHGYEKDFWNRNKAYKNQGYERFISEEDFDVTEENTIGFGINDEEFYKQSMDYLKELDSIDDNPFYAFMVSLTSHNPFNMPEEHKVLKIKKEHEGTLLGNYINSIHYADKEIGKFIEMLKEKGLYEDTVIALYGDHFAINSGNDKDKEIMTDYLGYEYRIDEMMRIPLLIHVPDEEINETISKVGSQMDMYPTIMNIMGVENEKGIVFGRDLVNYKGENLVAPQTYALKGSFISDDIVFIMSRDGVFENSSAYDLETREKVNPLDYREEYEKVISEINKGDYIMKKDLMKDILEGKDDLIVNKRYVKNLSMANTIKNTDSTLEAMEESLAEGYKAIKVRMKYNLLDEEVIVGKDISMDDFSDWLEEHKDVAVIAEVDNKENIRKVFINIANNYEDIKDRIYPKISTFDVYQSLKGKGYEVIVDISESDFTDKEVLDFVDRYSVNLISMDTKKGMSKLPKILKEKGVLSYIYNVDTRIQRYFLEKKYAQGVFTNRLK